MSEAGCTAFDRGGRRVRTATAARLVPRHPLLLAAYFGYRPCLPSITELMAWGYEPSDVEKIILTNPDTPTGENTGADEPDAA